MMTSQKVGIIVLPVPPPDLQVPPPATVCCGPIDTFEGGPSYERPPSLASQYEHWNVEIRI